MKEIILHFQIDVEDADSVETNALSYRIIDPLRNPESINPDNHLTT